MSETKQQMIARLRLMASGNEQWDLSEKDIDALSFALDRVRYWGKLVLALKLARQHTAHRPDCVTFRPTEEWKEKGSVSFENCQCDVSIIDDALKIAKEVV